MTVTTQPAKRRWLIVACAALAVALMAPAVAHAGLSKPASSYYQINGTSPVSGVQLSGYGSRSVYVAIRVTGGTAATGVTVAIPEVARAGLALPFGYGSWSGSSIAFTGSAADANRALKALTIVAPWVRYDGKAKANDVALTVTAFVFKDGLAFNPENEHFYRAYVYDSATASSEKTADKAKAAAEASTEMGLTGYLASITSAEENDFVTSKIPNAFNVWIGARDDEAEGTWKWVGGPDNGVAFWQGGAATAGGAPIEGRFARWNPDGEPNDYNQGTPGEDCAVTNWAASYVPVQYRQGYWNDLPCNRASDSRSIGGYVAEFGNKPKGGDFSGIDSVRATFKARPYVPKAKANLFDRVFSLLFTSKKRTALPQQPNKPATFTFQTKMRIVNPGTYVVTIKRKDGQGVPYLLLSGTKAQAQGAKAITLGSSRWSIEVTTTKANQRVTFNPVLKSRDWLKPAGTKLVLQLKTDPSMRCPLGWCQSTPIPSPRDQGTG